jgi:hypothetical protein
VAGDALRKVAPGETLRIPAGAYNAFIDAAQDFQRRQRDQTSTSKAAPLPGGVVLVRNDSGADRERFEILGVDGPLFGPSDNLDEFKNRPALVGVTPAADVHKGRFVVLMEPVKAGELARALAVGITPVRLVISEPEEGEDVDKFADVGDGPESLASSKDGTAAILWAENSPGEGWALVRFPAGGGGGGGETPEIVYQ